EIARGDKNVVDVAEQAATAAPHQRRKKIRLGDGRMLEAQIARWVLNENAPAKRLLQARDVRRDHVEALFGIGQGQEIVEIGPAGDAPGKMLGDDEWLGAVDQGFDPGEMLGIDA